MPRPLAKRSAKNVSRMRARGEYERARAKSRVALKDAGTGYFAMHNGMDYGVARTRFTPEQLLRNGESVEMLLRQGAPPRELAKIFTAAQIRAAVKKVAAQRMERGHRTKDILSMKRGAKKLK